MQWRKDLYFYDTVYINSQPYTDKYVTRLLCNKVFVFAKKSKFSESKGNYFSAFSQ